MPTISVTWTGVIGEEGVEGEEGEEGVEGEEGMGEGASEISGPQAIRTTERDANSRRITYKTATNVPIAMCLVLTGLAKTKRVKWSPRAPPLASMTATSCV